MFLNPDTLCSGFKCPFVHIGLSDYRTLRCGCCNCCLFLILVSVNIRITLNFHLKPQNCVRHFLKCCFIWVENSRSVQPSDIPYLVVFALELEPAWLFSCVSLHWDVATHWFSFLSCLTPLKVSGVATFSFQCLPEGKICCLSRFYIWTKLANAKLKRLWRNPLRDISCLSQCPGKIFCTSD